MPHLRVLPWWLVLLSTAVSAPAFGKRPPKHAVVALRAGSGEVRGPSELVSSWEGLEPNQWTLIQDTPLEQPEYRRVGLGGRPALHFDGNDRLETSDSRVLADYTKVFAVSFDRLDSLNDIAFGSAGTDGIGLKGESRPRIRHGASELLSPVPVSVNRVVLLVATYSSTDGIGRLYQDQVLVAEGPLLAPTDSGLEIGGRAGVGSLRGSVAEVLVYDRVLLPEEIDAVHGYLQRRFRSPLEGVLDLQQFPASFALVPRSLPEGLGYVPVNGTVADPVWERVRLTVLRDGEVWSEDEVVLDHGPSTPAPFFFEAVLSAGLFEYDFRLHLVGVDGSQQLAGRTDRVVCGDAFLVMGQSNACAYDFHLEDQAGQYESPWIRTFGSAVADPVTQFDLHWDVADGVAKKDHASVGAWPIRLAHEIVLHHQIPVAVINGALESTTIADHQRNDANPTDLGTLYGRLLRRAVEAGVAPGLRAMLWYQGESDLENRVEYKAKFPALLSDWAADYPSFEHVYTFQVHKGCGVFVEGVRDLQRLFPDTYPILRVMSSEAAPHHDGCHYYFAGYDELGLRLYRQIDRDLYDGTDLLDIDAPNVSSAHWVDSGHDQIVLTFRDPQGTVFWQSGVEQYLLLDGNGAKVVGATSEANTLTLDLDRSSTATEIGYDGHQFDGPWIVNSRGIGAFTFFHVKIGDPP